MRCKCTAFGPKGKLLDNFVGELFLDRRTKGHILLYDFCSSVLLFFCLKHLLFFCPNHQKKHTVASSPLFKSNENAGFL